MRTVLFTQEEIKDVIQYAADRYITIIPGREFPDMRLPLWLLIRN
ncbi:MAG: family 20 glycosylhydrolase [Butyricimonas faecihominis]